MCGLTGILDVAGRPASPVILRRMTRRLTHRGPDDEGLYCHGGIGLGHRRLAILDLSPAGHQPMMSPDGRLVLVYNGEVYNYLELRAELEARGCRFRSQCDTEVVLHALAEWGEEAVTRFNGMFALACWDRRQQRLLLARDRYGIKPLYLARAEGVFLFASEIKALLAHPALLPAVDREGLFEYMNFQNFFGERTLFAGVSMIPSGTLLTITPAGTVTSRRYWDFQFQEFDPALSRPDDEEHLVGLFNQAVTRQVMGDVPVGAYLSGGIDSGSITAVASAHIPGMTTFTIGSDLHTASGLELSFDERAASEYISYLFQTEHYEMVLKSGDMERCIKSLVWHMEEPRVGQSYPNYYAAKLASRFAKVVLSGAGGDELFGGYPWRYFRGLEGGGDSDFDTYLAGYFAFWQRLLPDAETAREIFRPMAAAVGHLSAYDIFRDVFKGHRCRSPGLAERVNHALYFEAKTFLHGLLVVEDKINMAHGVENRVPFLDNDLVDFALQVPVAKKVRLDIAASTLNENEKIYKSDAYYAHTRHGKLILRSAMARFLPEEVTQARKQGFSTPDASWFRGRSMDYVHTTLGSPQARLYQYLDYPTVAGLIDRHLSGRTNLRLLIWSLLYLENWLELFLSGDPGRLDAPPPGTVTRNPWRNDSWQEPPQGVDLT